MNPKTLTGQITAKAFELLEQNPDGLGWSELNRMIRASNHNFHPKTINGTVWKLTEKYPDKVYKPTKGVFRLVKYNK